MIYSAGLPVAVASPATRRLGALSNRVNRLTRGFVLRKFAVLASACAVLLLATVVHAQQIDLALGGSTLFSSKNGSAAQGYVPPAEKSGLYPSFSGDVLFKKKNRLGVSLDVALRAKQGLYNGYQNFRPVFTDVNAIYSAPTGKKTKVDLMAGIGVEDVLFYNHFGVCNANYAACPTYINANHFMAHVGGGVRYYFWRRFFVRPEAHLYLIPNNAEFNSNYVARVGASIGYSLAPR
jgi:hypothetical protein